MGKKEENKRNGGGVLNIHCENREVDTGHRYFACTIPSQFSTPRFLMLPPRAVEGKLISLLRSKPYFILQRE